MENEKIYYEKIYPLREWMPFSDKEIGIFQFYFFKYFTENEHNLSKEQIYILAVFGCEVQYQMRILKERIAGEKVARDISNNDAFIDSLMQYDGLTEYVKNKVIAAFNETDITNQHQWKQQTYSYFTATDEIKESIKKDFDNYFKKYCKE